MTKKTKRRRKIRIGRVYDLLLVLIYTILAVITALALHRYTFKFMIAVSLILLLILAIYILTLFYNKRWIEYSRRIVLTLLCACLMFGSTQLNNLTSFFAKLTQGKDEYVTTEVALLSLSDSDVFTATVNTLDDIEGKKVAINAVTDKNAIAYVQKELDAKYASISYVEYSDFNNMMKDLYYGYVDVICLNTVHESTLAKKWGDLSAFTTLLHTYEYKEKIEIGENEKDITNEVFTVLISANDETGAPANYSKSDANMLVIMNPNNHQMTLVSIPRDSYIGNPAYGYMSDKLTHTGNNGVENTREAVEAALGIDVDFYVKVSFTSVINIIDALGEIEVNVPVKFCEQNERRSHKKKDQICLNVGTQKINGKQALAFARHRHSYQNQDLGRNQAQLQVIKGIVKKMLTPEGIAKIDDVLEIIPTYVITNFSNGQIQSFIKSQIDNLHTWSINSLSLANGLAAENIVTASMPGVGTSVYYLNKNDVYTLQSVVNAMQEEHSLQEFSFEIDRLFDDGHTFKEGTNTVYYDPAL